MWISVHDTVDGPKLRKLKMLAGCSKGEALGVLTAVWQWGAKNADEDGRIRDSTEDDIAYVVLPYLSNGVDSREFVENMVEAGWIDREGDELYFHDWEEWQGPWYKYQREKNRDTERRRKRRRAKRDANGESSTRPDGEEPGAETEASQEGQEPTQQAEKPKKATKPKPEKKKYAEFVSLTEEEYWKLVERFGEPAVQKMIDVLDNYKGQNGKKYASDYRAILNWVCERVKEKNPGLIRPQAPPQSTTGGLGDVVPEEWRRGRSG